MALAAVAAAAAVVLSVACGDDDDRRTSRPTSSTTSTTRAERSRTTGVPSTTAAPEGPVEVVASDVATGLEAPWSIAFLPDDTALVSERDSARILSVSADGEVAEVQQLPAHPQGEGGLLGLAVSPDYEQDRLVYAYYTTAEDNRVARFRIGEEPHPILTGIPSALNHNGGRLAFGPDGLLYVTTGDAGQRSAAQDPASLAGKVLRLNPDGSVPEGNPFGNLTWSLGHRNVQGLAWTTEGELFATEFGQDRLDEVNLVEAGANHGWPEVEGPGGAPEYVDPVASWSTDEASPSGAAILLDGAIPQWEGDLLLGALRGERVWRLDLDGASVASEESLYVGEFGRVRHVAQAPDGSLWLLTSNLDGRGDPRDGDDRVVRLGPAP
jgi:glucose/arabinose dehydrogenase